MSKIFRICTLLILSFSLVSPVFAQDNPGSGPTYIIQPGDTLWTIARNFHISYNDLLEVNDLTSESSIIPGTVLEIPGMEEISGKLSIVKVAYGESLQSISRRYDIPEGTLVKLNRLTSP
ncbi:MAG: LysM peptidoglycan-binding domain-containing protein, partial [Anaerolineales bacterium]